MMEFSESDRHQEYELMHPGDLLSEFEMNSNKIWREISNHLIFKKVTLDPVKDRLIRK